MKWRFGACSNVPERHSGDILESRMEQSTPVIYPILLSQPSVGYQSFCLNSFTVAGYLLY